MPRGIEYRVLERREGGGDWTPFAIAYQRGDHLVLFNPAWRGHQDLDAKSLENLRERHFPSEHSSDECRWSEIKVCDLEVANPIDILARELSMQPSLARPAPERAPTVLEAIQALLRSSSLVTAPGRSVAGVRESFPEMRVEGAEAESVASAIEDLLTALADPDVGPRAREAVRAFARAARRGK